MGMVLKEKVNVENISVFSHWKLLTAPYLKCCSTISSAFISHLVTLTCIKSGISFEITGSRFIL